MCGEQLFVAGFTLSEIGSPPRVRGTVFNRVPWVRHGGITPACAGNRPRRKPYTWLFTDHPRVCGEQKHGRPRRASILGSPPRVRGTGKSVPGPAGKQGITPACAGNSRDGDYTWMTPKDHPRVCGEQNSGPLGLLVRMGSPPRVRGTEGGPMITREEARITPACAGNSASVWSYRLWHSGSPPRVRGTGPNVPAFGDHAGITPACAGNSNFGSIGGKGK